MLVLASLGLVRCELPNLFAQRLGNIFGRKVAPYRADRQDDIFIYRRVHTTSLSPTNESVIPLILETNTLSNSISRERYPWNSYRRAPSPSVYALTLPGYPRFLLPPARLRRWRRARYLSDTTKEAYPKVLRFLESPRNIASSMGEDTCSNLPLRVMLHL
jgi:hypothetical protein